MRTTLLVCAALASFAVCAQLQAQDCRRACQGCPDDVSEISIMFDNNRCGCPQGGCAPGSCAQGSCAQAGCNENGCTQDGCDQNSCGPDGCNQSDCGPNAYYQKRAHQKKHLSELAAVARYVHESCPKKHHHKHNGNQAAFLRASQTPWHGDYYYPQWGGAPVALVVPPTAQFQTNYSWGVPASRISPIDAQFSRNFPGYVEGAVDDGYGFLPPPQQPSDTNQFGVYYVRGPW